PMHWSATSTGMACIADATSAGAQSPGRPEHMSPIDRLILQFDQALRTLVPGSVSAERANPADSAEAGALSTEEARHAAGLMRINHCGEVCAQALYQGQALTARLPEVRGSMERAAK